MRAVIQAVSSASVRVEGGEPRAIGPGIMILLGVRDTDTLDIVPKLADKCAGLRIFPDAEGKLDLRAEQQFHLRFRNLYQRFYLLQHTATGTGQVRAAVPSDRRKHLRA